MNQVTSKFLHKKLEKNRSGNDGVRVYMHMYVYVRTAGMTNKQDVIGVNQTSVWQLFKMSYRGFYARVVGENKTRYDNPYDCHAEVLKRIQNVSQDLYDNRLLSYRTEYDNW